MKLKYISPFAAILLLLATQFLTAGCDRNEDDITSSGQQQPDNTGNGNTDKSNALCIVTTKQPFADETGTRASTDFGGTYATTFETGDEIGVIAVKDGAVLDDCNNVKLTYNATGSKWEGDNPVYFKDGATYIAYYPYQAVMDGKKSTQEIYDAFNVPADQSTYKKFASADLMTSTTCTADKTAKTLTIDFKHRLAMLEMERLYCRSVTTGFVYPLNSVEPYEVHLTDKIPDTVVLGYRLPDSNFPLMYFLVKPGNVHLTAVYQRTDTSTAPNITLNESSKTYNLTGGKRHKFKVYKTRTIQVNDYFYSDGSFYPKEWSTPPGIDKGCAGIVFATPDCSNGTSMFNMLQVDMDRGWKNGYVVSVEAIDTSSFFGASGYTPGTGSVNNLGKGDESLLYNSVYSGYDGMMEMKKVDFKDGSGNIYYYHTLSYNKDSSFLPTGSNIWFTPSGKQAAILFRNLSGVSGGLFNTSQKISWHTESASDVGLVKTFLGKFSAVGGSFTYTLTCTSYDQKAGSYLLELYMDFLATESPVYFGFSLEHKYDLHPMFAF